MLDPLFTDMGADPQASPRASFTQNTMLPDPQWRAELLQVANWGGFEGVVPIEFATGSTLLSGASGAGKSTILDAYIALMMDSSTSFNGASNEAQSGRARSAEQRNLLSYLRGKLDTTEEDGQQVDKVLRGRGKPTWGAVAMTFVSDHGHRFTAARTYWVPARATRSGEISMRMLTLDGGFDLHDLERFAVVGDDHFPTQQLRAAFPMMRTHDKYVAFSQAIFTKLGIGAGGEGTKALRLLARIQAGQHIRTVDELYKDMVLERPETFEKADLAIGHFNELEASYQAMVDDQRKVETLRPITAAYTERQAAVQQLHDLDTLGLTTPGDTPARLWQLRTRSGLLEQRIRQVRDQLATNRELRHAIDAEEREAETRSNAAAAAYNDAGGQLLSALGVQIAKEHDTRTARNRRLEQVQQVATVEALPLAGRNDFDAVRQVADTLASALGKRLDDLDNEHARLGHESYPLHQRKSEVATEKDSLSKRKGRVPADLDNQRREAASAAGLDVEDLPFVAELIDIRSEHDQWRLAIETLLAGEARTMLVPREHLERLSRAINSLPWRKRLHFEGVERHACEPGLPADDTLVTGKLTFKDSPYAGWVKRKVLSRNARCVYTPEELAGDELRVTLSGQTRRGTRGAHGTTGQHSIIGFSNTDLIGDLDAEIAELEVHLTRIATQQADLREQSRTLNERNARFATVRQTAFDDIDVWSCDAKIQDLETQRHRLLAADSQLHELEEQASAAKAAYLKVAHRRQSLDEEREDLDARHAQLVEDQDTVHTNLYRIEDAGEVDLTPATQQMLDTAFAEAGGGDLEGFDSALVRTFDKLRATSREAQRRVEQTTEALERQFGLYKSTFDPDNPNLGVSVDAYREYAEILQAIESTGLHERRDKWRKALVEWSGEDLVPLAHAMTASIDEIEDRLGPINDILRQLPFGASDDRLQIRLRRLQRDNVTSFRAELKRLSSQATTGVSDDQLQRRFLDLQQFMARIRERADPHLPNNLAALADRDHLLDVRRHVEITAERRDVTLQNLLSTHSSLAGKSGGETQELVAFIVGAALRYRLGDDLRSRPRFAPVVIDEGFIKSDSEFAGRAVEAWRGLGFQLIIGAPLDKVTALEPYADLVLSVTKRVDKGYSYVTPLRTTTPGQPR
ncbi:ATP-binding protein [Cellulomonas xiejunii]|uniref:AAA family ATPase n=2 Tax=Cellulomonas xiejunii TaxID=2968083 RepID=A0ABY5KPP4_9CELL|nr:SbcC/MukB-like Walker B domain-containing protein [Cellulomonas xiejunii]UUI71848.1 AAA family ATPase [Cellulomonas xiejunii]